MNLLFHPGVLEHLVAEECPEKPERLELVLSNPEIVLTEPNLEELLPQIEPYLSLVHTPEYQKYVRVMAESIPPGEIVRRQKPEDEISFSPKTYEAACYAVLTTLTAAESAVQGKKSFALVRPPGHHAHKERESGFCFFNNVALATELLRQQGQRVMIIDIDLHLGDGTLEYGDGKKEVFYFSINQVQTWPYLQPAATGNSHNLFLPKGIHDDVYIRTLHEHLEPLLESFHPTMIAVSAGFDTHYTDALHFGWEMDGGFRLTKKSYTELWKILDQTGLPYFAVLEGGYHPQSVLEGVSSFLEK